MRCCDHAWSRRRWMWGSLLTTAAAVASACARSTGSAGTGSSGAPESRPDPEETTDLRAAATGLLRQHISIDVHTHAGPQGITSRAAPSDQLAHSMRRGGIAVLCLADVPDAPILGRDSRNVLRALRTPAPGQLYQYHLERLEWLDTLTTRHGIRRVLSVADLDATHRAGEPAIILDIEGLDFLEQLRLARVGRHVLHGKRTAGASLKRTETNQRRGKPRQRRGEAKAIKKKRKRKRTESRFTEHGANRPHRSHGPPDDPRCRPRLPPRHAAGHL